MLFIKILQFVVLLRTLSESPKFLYRPLYRVCNSVYAHAILSSNICKLAPTGEAPPEPAELCVRYERANMRDQIVSRLLLGCLEFAG